MATPSISAQGRGLATKGSALAVTAWVMVLSRAWIFLFAAGAAALVGPDASLQTRFGIGELDSPFGGAGAELVEVWSRWDSVWYLGIANLGYDADGSSAAFFPLYPLVTRGLATLGGGFDPSPGVVFASGIAVSLAALGGALYLLHRLVELELGSAVATSTVALTALFPTAVFYGAIYSESLFLLATVAAFWFARNDRWALAGLAGAAAAATRSAGLLLVVPLAIIYFSGPRGAPARQHAGEGFRARLAALKTTARPPGPDAIWLALVPAGLVAYMAYLGIATGEPLRFQEAQDFWARSFGSLGVVPLGPVAGIVEGVGAGLAGAWEIAGGATTTIWSPEGEGSLARPGINIEALAFTVFAAVATIGALRRLPLAYGAFAAASLLWPLTFPREATPLFSMPRFVAVIFPLFMWLALVLVERGWERRGLAVSAALAALYAAQWGTWQWVS